MLSRLSANELNDLGICRGNIESIARLIPINVLEICLKVHFVVKRKQARFFLYCEQNDRIRGGGGFVCLQSCYVLFFEKVFWYVNSS